MPVFAQHALLALIGIGGNALLYLLHQRFKRQVNGRIDQLLKSEYGRGVAEGMLRARSTER